MKKFLFVSIAILISTAVNAQDISDVISKYKHYEEAESFKMGSFLLSFAKPFILSEAEKDEPGYEFIKSLDLKGMNILDLSDCASSVKSNLKADIAKVVSGAKYQVLMNVHDDEDDVAFYAKVKGNSVSEIVIYVQGEDCSLIQFDVNAKMADIQRILSQANDNG